MHVHLTMPSTEYVPVKESSHVWWHTIRGLRPLSRHTQATLTCGRNSPTFQTERGKWLHNDRGEWKDLLHVKDAFRVWFEESLAFFRLTCDADPCEQHCQTDWKICIGSQSKPSFCWFIKYSDVLYDGALPIDSFDRSVKSEKLGWHLTLSDRQCFSAKQFDPVLL